jgi:uncharacterized protein DUF6526
MADQSQTYKNHVRWFAPLHFFVLPVLLANALNAIRHVWQNPALSTGFALVVAVAIFALAVLARVMAVTVQDRVIRLEMRLRLRECLPTDLRNRINDLTPTQLVALRFASDAELAEMVRDVLAGKLSSQREIKMRVKDWQGDFLRA